MSVQLEQRLERVGLGYRHRFEYARVLLAITRLRERGGQLHGELVVERYVGPLPNGFQPPNWEVAAAFTLNVSGHDARSRAARYLNRCNQRRSGTDVVTEGDWESMLETFSSEVLAAHRRSEVVVVLGGPEDPDEDGPSMILRPIVWAGAPTLIFGPGGTGKSTLAAAAAVSVETGREIVPGWQPTSAPVLVLDWEDSRAEWGHQVRAICRGADVEAPHIAYWRMSGPLADSIEQVAAYCTEHAVGLIVVDSVEAACGSSSEETYTARADRLFDALRELEAAALLLDHVAGADLDTKDTATAKPIGAVRKRDRARAMYELRAQKEPARERIEVVLLDSKRNRRARQDPVSLVMEFDDFDRDGRAHMIRYRHQATSEAPELAAISRSLAARIEELLVGSTRRLKPIEIARELSVDSVRVRSELSKGKGRRFAWFEDGTYGAMSHQ